MQSGLYNDKTTVKTNNFTAVGYYLSARITPEYIQIQILNINTGKIEGDVTVNW